MRLKQSIKIGYRQDKMDFDREQLLPTFGSRLPRRCCNEQQILISASYMATAFQTEILLDLSLIY